MAWGIIGAKRVGHLVIGFTDAQFGVYVIRVH